MEERFRRHYFVLLRIALLLGLEIYIIIAQSVLTGASAGMLLLLALFTGAVVGKELFSRRYQKAALAAAGIIWYLVMSMAGPDFALLGVYLCYEILTCFKLHVFWYLLPLALAFIPNVPDRLPQLLVAVFIGLLYWQHDFIVEQYQKERKEDLIAEQNLKHRMNLQEYEMQEEVRRGLLIAENQMLEQREQLSQTLHDKLGHNINGSVYQLEAVKVLMEKEPETAGKMVQAVIDQLRGGMNEIRTILRKERPPKYQLALLELEKLCEDCVQKGVHAELVTEGDLKSIPEKHLEVILDNAYEAVSNSMKYANCSKITIHIHVLNQMLRCSVADDGIGCVQVQDGMGISGMRKRMREMNGILDFETEAGFTINMLLPL